MAEDKTKDFGDYAESYEKVDPARRVVARKYIVELCFMEEQLDRLRKTSRKMEPSTTSSRASSLCCAKARP